MYVTPSVLDNGSNILNGGIIGNSSNKKSIIYNNNTAANAKF